MSVFVGFDPERLAQLRQAMVAASVHLRAVAARHQDDLELGDTARVLSDVRRLLDSTWIPIIGRILTSQAISGYRPIDAGAVPAPWSRQPDPLGPRADRREAAAIAADSAWDRVDLERLVEALARIARDPDAVTAFRVAMSRDDWIALIDRVGHEYLTAAHLSVEDAGNRELRRRMIAADEAAALLALLLRGQHTGHLPWRPELLHQVEPFAAALVVRHLDLDASTLADTADRLLLRWYQGRPDGDRFADGHRSGPNTGDLLVPLLIAEPAAATAFLQQASHHPGIVFMSAQDQRLVRALLVVGTAPPRVGPSTAGTILPALLRWSGEARRRAMPHDGGTPDGAAYLAEASAPWLLYFGRRASEWGWSGPEADRALRDLIDDERAMEQLTSAMAGWRRSLTTTPLTDREGRVDLETLLDLSTMFAQLQLAFRDEEIDDDAAGRFWLEVTLFTGTLVASAAMSGGFLASVGTDLALTVASATGAAALGRFGVATSAERSQRQAAARFGSRSADVAVIAVVSAVGQLIDDGRLPVHTLDRLRLPAATEAECTSTVVADRLAAFVSSLEPLTDATTFNALTAVMTAFVNPSSARQACR
ncbi:MAG: hypothetical protein RI958_2793 [Actinomycetota bacterium]